MTRKVLSLLAAIVASTFFAGNAGAEGPKPIVPSSNEFELIGYFVRPPLCVYPGERQKYIIEVRNIGSRLVHGQVDFRPMLGDIAVSFARPSLRGTSPYYLYWPLALLPGRSARLQVNLVVPTWLMDVQYGPVSFWVGAEIIVPTSKGRGQFISTTAEVCSPAVGGGK